MPFTKGNTLSKGGRQVGQLNRMKPESALTKIGRFAPLERLREVWSKLTPEQQIKIIMELMDFFHPKYTPKKDRPTKAAKPDYDLNIAALMQLASEKDA